MTNVVFSSFRSTVPFQSTPYIRNSRGVCPQLFDICIKPSATMHRISIVCPSVFPMSNCPCLRSKDSFCKESARRTYVAPRGPSRMTSTVVFIPLLPPQRHPGLHPWQFLVLLGQSWASLSLVWAPGVLGLHLVEGCRDQ